MTNTQINAFLVLYETESAAKASEKLFITQPALSRIIRSIEDELGYPLFIREKGKSLTPTIECDRFYNIACNMRRLYNDALNPSLGTARRSFRVAAPASLFYSFFPDACIRFRSENQDIDIVIDELHSIEAYRQIQLNQLDFAIVSTRLVNSNMVTIPLVKEKVVLLCSRGMFPGGPVSPKQLDKELAVITEWSPDFQSYFEYWFGKNFETSRLRFKTGCHIQHFSGLKQFWAVVPYLSAVDICRTGDMEYHELSDAPPQRICYCIYRREDAPDLKESMLDCLRSSISKYESSEGIYLI